MTKTDTARALALPSPPLLVALVAVASAAALMLEIVAGRLVAPYLGTSLHTWTAIIAVVLAGLALGALMGGRLADGSLARGRDALMAALGGAALFTLLTPVLLRRTAASAGAGDLPPTAEVLVLATAMLLVPSVFAGLVAPLATRLAVAQTPADGIGRLLGRIFAAGSGGSIAGTLLAGFVLIGYLGSLRSVLLIAALYALAAVAVAPATARSWRTALLAVAAVGVVYGAGRTVEAWHSPCDAESAHSCIRVDAFAAPGGGPARVLVIDDLTHGINVRDDAGLFVMGYLDLADRLARQRFDGVPARSFFVGGGAYTLPRAWLAAGGEVVVAEIDPLVTATAERRLWLERGPGLTIRHADARRALEALPATPRFDVVIGDAFRDITVPPHLVTREFNALVRARLAPDGLYMVNLIDAPTDPAFVAAVARTLEASFAQVTVWRSHRDDGASGRVNHLVVASDTPVEATTVEGKPPFARRWTRVELDRDDAPLLTDDYSPVERLLGAPSS